MQRRSKARGCQQSADGPTQLHFNGIPENCHSTGYISIPEDKKERGGEQEQEEEEEEERRGEEVYIL